MRNIATSPTLDRAEIHFSRTLGKFCA
jgi:hypothetical protein